MVQEEVTNFGGCGGGGGKKLEGVRKNPTQSLEGEKRGGVRISAKAGREKGLSGELAKRGEELLSIISLGEIAQRTDQGVT